MAELEKTMAWQPAVLREVLGRTAAARALGRPPQPLNVAEIGTGSGALAIALVDEARAPLRLTATDISGEALAVARANALRTGVGSRITFVHGDLAEPLIGTRAPGDPPHLDLLIANLPYVPTAEVDAAHAAASFHPESETHRDLSHVSIAAEPRRAPGNGATPAGVLLAWSLMFDAFVFSPLWLIPPLAAVWLNVRVAHSMAEATGLS